MNALPHNIGELIIQISSHQDELNAMKKAIEELLKHCDIGKIDSKVIEFLKQQRLILEP